MKNSLLWMLAATSTCFSTPTPGPLQDNQSIIGDQFIINNFLSLKRINAATFASQSLDSIHQMLQKESPALSQSVINKIMTTLKCARGHETENNHILTVIDYSLPSSERRLWVFDLNNNKLLYHTYVSHGIKSGTLSSTYFSNKYNSKASSIGAYSTEKSYYGRDGLSLRLDGLDRGFNDNAQNRAVVMHGGWYVNEDFIKKYGRAGRSWGCPALPLNLTESIINTIKDKSLMVIYYPSDDWFAKSKFLNCNPLAHKKIEALPSYGFKLPIQENEVREDILFVDLNKNNKHEESEPVVVMEASQYAKTFHITPPLSRMLRRQINQQEYIALSTTELKKITTPQDTEALNSIYFVYPVIKMRRGYYFTEMTIRNLGKIKDIKSSEPLSPSHPYDVNFEGKSTASLKTSNQFIRWVGL